MQIDLKTAGQITTATVEGAINTDTVSVFREKLNKLDDSEKLVLDFDKVTYISSIGLRVLLTKRKIFSGDSMEIINVSPEVYDIFEVTGFNQIMKIKKKIPEISVDGCKIIGQGGSGTVYRFDDERIVKLFLPERKLEEIELFRSSAKKLFLCGVPTTITYNIVHCKDRYGVIYELINSKSLAETLLDVSEEEFSRLVIEYAQCMRSVHEIELERGEFPDAKQQYLKTLEYIWPALEKDKQLKIEIQEVLDNIPQSNHLVHCDLHTGNVMLQNGELLVIDLDSMGQGHPIFDLATAYTVFSVLSEILPQKVGAIADENYLHINGVRPEWKKKGKELFFSTYFGTKDSTQLNLYLRQIEFFYLLYWFAHVLTFGKYFMDASEIADAEEKIQKKLKTFFIDGKGFVLVF